jgi:hypothetical protein
MLAKQEYLSYLLRLWLAGDGDQRQWRASLEDPHTGGQKGFDSLEELFAFLRGQTFLGNSLPDTQPIPPAPV